MTDQAAHGPSRPEQQDGPAGQDRPTGQDGPVGLDGYWQGDFTLRREGESPGGSAGQATPAGPPIERLAAPEITVRGRNLAVLLAPVYRALTS